jgi:hypothetical protein
MYTTIINPALNKIDLSLERRHIYKLSRSLHNVQSIAEFEQMYMRYNFMPYYMSFDICSLLMSVFHTHYIDSIIEKSSLQLFLLRYIDTSEGANTMFTIFNTDKTDFEGDFGKLITLFINAQAGISRNTVRFINYFNKYDFIHINMLQLSNDNKICLSLPFTPDFIQMRINKGKISETIAQPLITRAKLDYGNLYDTNQQYLKKFYDNYVNASVDYCFDWTNGHSDWNPRKPKFIIKTNRYSKKSLGRY